MAISAEALLAGPRGRRLLLEFALASAPGEGDELRSAVMLAAYRLDLGHGGSVALFGPGAAEAESAVVLPDDVAVLLHRAAPLEPDSATVLRALVASVDAARYWQEPDGEDRLAETGPVREALVPIAERVASSADSGWWDEPLDRAEQHAVTWDDDAPAKVSMTAAERLALWRSATIDGELRAGRERPAEPEALWSGEWWSTPPAALTRTTRALGGHGPAGLWLVEDGFGWERATTQSVAVPDGSRVYEVDGAAAWAALCLAHPLEVTAQKRHDWYRTTGRDGQWVMPDWAGVAEDHDAVHLTAAAYLAAAGTAVRVDDGSASIIAGWNPDETYWLREVEPADGEQGWHREHDGDWRHLTQ